MGDVLLVCVGITVKSLDISVDKLYDFYTVMNDEKSGSYSNGDIKFKKVKDDD